MQLAALAMDVDELENDKWDNVELRMRLPGRHAGGFRGALASRGARLAGLGCPCKQYAKSNHTGRQAAMAGTVWEIFRLDAAYFVHGLHL